MTSAAAGALQAFVVVTEYDPADGERAPVREHAYDLEHAQLAGHETRASVPVVFPAAERGWSATPQAPRCRRCGEAVDETVRRVDAGSTTTSRRRTR
ncbi:hypothetical protein SAMN05443575_0291 [Jatrophihabitans endophyticus]|uniref:Uncharacterized protein n=1 Tax=Jatrophihabitans endophyticus TaxID=1206085 RepID=A0A1M5CMG0_9ACTN|nr:hypothetical protein [Jatrophihabitans endophyticus]SHF55891.1 hypothetical protein SAMN05443575_0291 [Jatrophihabitans endophyticus]